MKIKFYLTRPDSDNETAVFTSVAHKNSRLKVYTGISVQPKYWNNKTHRVRQSPSYREGSSINTRLDQIQSEIRKCFYNYSNTRNGEPSTITFKKLIDTALGRTKETRLSFFEYFEDFIHRTKAGLRQTAKGKIVGPVRARSYGTTYHKLREFRPKLDFDTIDLDLYEDFTTWLRKQGYAENNIGKHITNLKALLNEATERGVNTNLAFKSKRFVSTREDVDNIALTTSELQDLQRIDLSGISHLDKVRDLFLIGCYTGLRYSDFSRLTPGHIKEGFIEITQSKTDSPVVIPVHSVVRQIIAKYGGRLPESISNQKTNDYLKEVCQRVPVLLAPASKTRTQGGMKMTTHYQKWEIVTTHTARRTFATNAYLLGVPTVTIMAVTGHKTEKAFLKYIKVTPKEHAKIMAGIWAKHSKLKIVN